jgi:protein-disulfide isomerase
MRNIWAIIVGVVVVAGAGVALYNAVGDGDAPRPARVAATQPTDQAADASAAPTPSATFSTVEITADDFVLGKDDAPVTLVEYASLTCPHCARFHTNVLPTIKSEYIDKGLVRLVYRDFPLDNAALMAAVVAQCAGRERYFGFLDALFAAQENWARAGDPAAALQRIAALGGMSQSEFNACLKNESIVDAVVKERLEADKKFGVNSTPTLLVNGEKYSGGLTAEQFRAVVAPKLN